MWRRVSKILAGVVGHVCRAPDQLYLGIRALRILVQCGLGYVEYGLRVLFLLVAKSGAWTRGSPERRLFCCDRLFENVSSEEGPERFLLPRVASLRLFSLGNTGEVVPCQRIRSAEDPEENIVGHDKYGHERHAHCAVIRFLALVEMKRTYIVGLSLDQMELVL